MLNQNKQNNSNGWSFADWVAKGGMKGYMKYAKGALSPEKTAKASRRYSCQRIPRSKRNKAFHKPVRTQQIRTQSARRCQRFAKRPDGSKGFTFKRTLLHPPGFAPVVNPVVEKVELPTVIVQTPSVFVEPLVEVQLSQVNQIEEPVVDAEEAIVIQPSPVHQPVEETPMVPDVETQLEETPEVEEAPTALPPSVATKPAKARQTKKHRSRNSKPTVISEPETPKSLIWLALLMLTCLLGSQLSSDSTNMIVVGMVGTVSILFFMYSLLNLQADDSTIQKPDVLVQSHRARHQIEI